MKRISERISFLEPDPSSDRPLLGYVRGSRLSLAFDAGASCRHVRLFYSELEGEGLPLPSLTVISHYHWDHSYGIAAINGLSIAGRGTYDHLLEDMKAPKERIYASSIADDYDFLRKEYSCPEEISIRLPDIICNGSLMIGLGDASAWIFHSESPHTDDSTLLYVPEDGVLFLGDAASGEISSASDLETGGSYDREKTMALMESIRRIGPLYVVESHAGAISVEEELDYLRSRLGS